MHGWDQHIHHILSKIAKAEKFKRERERFLSNARDFLNPKGLSLSGQLSVLSLSFCGTGWSK